MYKAYIFDLDGTLFDTLPDLVTATNYILEKYNMPTKTRNQVLYAVGGGGLRMLTKLVVEGTSPETVQQMYDQWEAFLDVHGTDLTRPFYGIMDMLATLKERGVKMAVLSNKSDEAAHQTIEEFAPGVFDVVHGTNSDFPRKPNPAGLFKTMEELGVTADECVFIGDSGNDMGVAANAGVRAIGVEWGYGAYEGLYDANPTELIQNPKQILEL